MADTKFQPGNKLWQFRNKHGRDHKYTPEGLWQEALGYFEWCDENFLVEEKGYSYMGMVTKEEFAKVRAMTIVGFCLYADIQKETFYNYEKDPDFFNIIQIIKSVIFEQKFTAAAADLLNANIISRELGLIDRIETTGTTKTEITVTSKEAQAEIDRLKKEFDKE